MAETTNPKKTMQILVASQNAGKQLEFSSSLGEVAQLVFPQSIPELDGFDVDETGESYEENALLKARGFAQKANIASLSDDSGIEITAMENQPGIHSKRFFPGSDIDRNQRVLDLLKDKSDRSARFICVLALVDPTTGLEKTFKAVVPGSIATQMHEGEGFAYDMLFIPEGYDKTYSQLGIEIKNKIGHRAVAMAMVKKYLEELA